MIRGLGGVVDGMEGDVESHCFMLCMLLPAVIIYSVLFLLVRTFEQVRVSKDPMEVLKTRVRLRFC